MNRYNPAKPTQGMFMTKADRKKKEKEEVRTEASSDVSNRLLTVLRPLRTATTMPHQRRRQPRSARRPTLRMTMRARRSLHQRNLAARRRRPRTLTMPTTLHHQRRLEARRRRPKTLTMPAKLQHPRNPERRRPKPSRSKRTRLKPHPQRRSPAGSPRPRRKLSTMMRNKGLAFTPAHLLSCCSICLIWHSCNACYCLFS